ncbi:MAG TPA: DUF6338 family protein [Gemmatimonadales bacterium]|jgi:hypothetical protein|nr:DUF6338 family protein [Gemmatimonadales bacterium]
MDKLVDGAFGILVLIVALLPGAAADEVFKRITGRNWREPVYRTTLRWLGLSLAGLALYVAAARELGMPPPIYVLPKSYAAPGLAAEALPTLLIPFTGHVFSAVVSAILISAVLWILARAWPEQPYGAWDVFVAKHVPSHWVVVGLEDGSAYQGKVRYAEKAVAAADRDLILEEPARFSPETGTYILTGHQHLFLPAKGVYSIATVYDPSIDEERILPATRSTSIPLDGS